VSLREKKKVGLAKGGGIPTSINKLNNPKGEKRGKKKKEKIV